MLKRKRNVDHKKIFLGFFFVFLGGTIYILFRETSLLMFSWFNILGIDEYIFTVREFSKCFMVFSPKWFYYSLPSGLWLMSGIILFSVIWENNQATGKIWIFSFLIIAFGSELGQAIKIVPGTFDTIDVLIMACCALLAFIVINFNRRVFNE